AVPPLQIVGLTRPAVHRLQIEAGGECIGRPAEDHYVRFQIIEKAVRRMGQLDDELFIEGVEVRLPIEAHNGNAVALLDAHIVQLHENAPLNSLAKPVAACASLSSDYHTRAGHSR